MPIILNRINITKEPSDLFKKIIPPVFSPIEAKTEQITTTLPHNGDSVITMNRMFEPQSNRKKMYHSLVRNLYVCTLFLLLIGTGTISLANTVSDSQNPPPTEPEPEEVVTIDGVRYPVPAPWLGNKVIAPQLSFEDFKKIPLKFCKDEGKIYVTIETQENLVTMLTKAEEDGILIQVESGYRSAGYQSKIFKRMLAEGRDFDDIIRYVAPPGYSNHVLGTAVDFSPSNWRFADTEQYQWLQENGNSFGFEELYSRYNKMKMPWEAWHWQYMGPPDSAETAQAD